LTHTVQVVSAMICC